MKRTLEFWNIGTIPQEPAKAEFFEDGELQFSTANGEHINISIRDTLRLVDWLTSGDNIKTLERLAGDVQNSQRLNGPQEKHSGERTGETSGS